MNKFAGDGCVIQLYRELGRCDALWGHDAEAAVGAQDGDAYNISQLIRYCRWVHAYTLSPITFALPERSW